MTIQGTGVDSSIAVLASTLNAIVQKYIEPTVFDQVLKSNPVLYRFWKKGPKIDGGASLIWPALTGTKVNGAWYTGSTSLPHGVEDTIQPAEVPWRSVAEDVTIPRTDLLKARGRYAKVDLVKTKFDEAIMNLRARISTALYVTDASGQSLDHLRQAIDDGTNFASYAGISHTATNPSGASFWKPGINGDGLFNVGGAATLANLQDLGGRASDGDNQPTLYIFTQKGYDFLWGQLQAQQRFMRDDEMTSAGFESLRFNRAVVVVDRNAVAQEVLAINEEWVDLVSHEDENFSIDPIIPGTPSERSINTKIVWSGNLRVKILRYMAKMTGATNL